MTAEQDLAAIVAIARAAGELALNMRRNGLTTRAKPGGSPVTDADEAVDAQLADHLGQLNPDYGWLSEETADDPARLTKRRLYVVDPIDGTVAFMKGRPWWCVSIAVVENGQPILGVLHAPEPGETYTAIVGQGAFLNGQPIRPAATADLAGCRMLGDAKMFGHPAWPKPWPAMRIETRNSIAYRMALVAAGTFDAALALSAKNEWDLAAADLICREAGAWCTDHRGRSFSYNRPNPRMPSLVCAAPALAPLILERVSPIDLRE
ncbi:MAG: 3(2),5-bisphosphate nucleotidase CysQ [Caulobacter sp.]|nr:3(2),5-bisphosphate nucleotidase CysQ [Caulobacter sp.]